MSARRSTVRCIQCKDSKIRCDMLWPACSSCVKRKRACWYVGDRSQHDGKDVEPIPVLRELCFVGQGFGTSEMSLLKTYVFEFSPIMRSPLPFSFEATTRISKEEGRTLPATMTPRLAALHVTAWSAISIGAFLRRSPSADIYLGNAMQAARLCYDVPCLETLTAMIAIIVAADINDKSGVSSLFSGYAEILSVELSPGSIKDVQVQYLRALVYLLSSRTKIVRIRKRRQSDPSAQTTDKTLSFSIFELGPKAIMIAPIQGPLLPKQAELLMKEIHCQGLPSVHATNNSVEEKQATLVKEEIRKVELSLREHKVAGDHFKIHMALSLLFFLSARAGETSNLVPIAKLVVDFCCSHPLLLQKHVWRIWATGFSTFLCRCGETGAAAKMWNCLKRFRPSNVDVLHLVVIESPIERTCAVGTQISEVPENSLEGTCIDREFSTERFILALVKNLTALKP